MTNGLSLPAALLTVIMVLMLAYWCSRLLGKNWANAASGKHMRIIDQIQLGQDKRIVLVKLGEQNYLVGVSPAGIELLTAVEGEFEDEAVLEQKKGASFKEQMEQYLESHRRKGGDR